MSVEVRGPVISANTGNLDVEVVEVARGDFCQHALSQGVTASGKNGLHDLIPLTVNEGLAVNAGVDQLLVLDQSLRS